MVEYVKNSMGGIMQEERLKVEKNSKSSIDRDFFWSFNRNNRLNDLSCSDYYNVTIVLSLVRSSCRCCILKPV